MTFTAGKTGNASGRPKGTGKPVSRLRQLERKLKELSDQSLVLIQQELDWGSGKDGVKPVDKEALSTAKWTVTTYTAVRKAAEQEENLKLGGSPTQQAPSDPSESQGSDSDGEAKGFTLQLVQST